MTLDGADEKLRFGMRLIAFADTDRMTVEGG